ncbi:MAG: CaiB/BaiF CoA transferase family protein, partial [Acidimicrobiales bacterium]
MRSDDVADDDETGRPAAPDAETTADGGAPDDSIPRPLDGIRVVELAQWIAGPSAAGLMADWGADVVKVEAPSGDPQRGIFKSLGIEKELPNPTFAQDNRGKRSVVLDLGHDDARATFDRLLQGADVFITNVRPDALQRLDLDPADVLARHPRLVVASQTGYGSVGPERNTAGYDIGAFVARSGMARINRPKDESPIFLRGGIGDHTTGISTCAGVLAALVERGRTGRGRLVETSLFQTGLYTMSADIGTQLTLGRLGSMRPRESSKTPMVNCYRAADDRWFYLIGVEAARHWPNLCRAVDHEHLIDDDRFNSASKIAENRVELIAMLDEIFASEDLEHWAARFAEADVWWAPCQTAAEVAVDPQALALESFHDTTDGDTTVTTVASPVRFDGVSLPPAGPVPQLGEHTDAVLDELQ